MDRKLLDDFAKIPQPERETYGFVEDLKKPLDYCFRPGMGRDPGAARDCMLPGVEIRVDFPVDASFPGMAFQFLRWVLKAKNIGEKTGNYPLRFVRDGLLVREEYCLEASMDGVTLAADGDGLRSVCMSVPTGHFITTRNISRACRKCPASAPTVRRCCRSICARWRHSAGTGSLCVSMFAAMLSPG